uniref:MARVEL domain-containing protein n=1 Tax=Anisakis simplex TaxID=6269 RepID=A0A0M3K618_ANISI
LKTQLREYVSGNNEIDFLKSVLPTITTEVILETFSDAIIIIVSTVGIVHLLLTILALYGIYACRPNYVRPMVADAATSLLSLLSFVLHSLYSCWKVNRLPPTAPRPSSDRYLRNVYIGAAFLLTYFIWLAITIAAYLDVTKLRADFMYWIVQERASMYVHNNTAENLTSSTDRKSERFSKSPNGSRTSRASKTSRASRVSQCTPGDVV